MITVPVTTATASYDVHIGSGILDRAGELIRPVLRGKAALIADTTVDALYGDRAAASLANAGFEVLRYAFPAGEENKNLTEYARILTFLAENPNRVFKKDELFRKIWDMESVGDIATVTVHIKKIREKIEFNSAKPQYIETIWGIGYRFKI